MTIAVALRQGLMLRISVSRRRLKLVSLRILALAAMTVGSLVTLLSAPVQAAGPAPRDPGGRPANTFVILLQGKYKPVVQAPDLGLLQVDLDDGSYSKTKIYRVSGLPEEDSGDGEMKEAIGNFYVQFAGTLAAYDLPGGALTMVFTAQNLTPVPDGQGGTYFVGTLQLDITEATGIYQSFVGGHNNMVDILHQLADGTFVEHCFCIISRKV